MSNHAVVTTSPEDGAAPRLIASVATDPDLGASTGTPERDWHGKATEYLQAPTTTLGVREDLDRVNSPSVQATITAAVRDIVELEGPVEITRLARDIGRRFGFGRVTAGRVEFITGVVPAELIRSSDFGDFVWPTQLDPETWRGYRNTPPDVTRPLTEIAPEEVVNAMMHSCAHRRVSEEELMRDTLARFGQKRLTAQSQELLFECITFGLKTGSLLRDDDEYRRGA